MVYSSIISYYNLPAYFLFNYIHTFMSFKCDISISARWQYNAFNRKSDSVLLLYKRINNIKTRLRIYSFNFLLFSREQNGFLNIRNQVLSCFLLADSDQELFMNTLIIMIK